MRQRDDDCHAVFPFQNGYGILRHHIIVHRVAIVSASVCLDPQTEKAESREILYKDLSLNAVSQESVRLIGDWLEVKCSGSVGGRSGLIGVYRVKKDHKLSPLKYKRSWGTPKITIAGKQYVSRIFEKYCNELVNRKYAFLSMIARDLEIQARTEISASETPIKHQLSGDFIVQNMIPSRHEPRKDLQISFDSTLVRDDVGMGTKKVALDDVLMAEHAMATVFNHGIAIRGSECALLFRMPDNFSSRNEAEASLWAQWFSGERTATMKPCLTIASTPNAPGATYVDLHTSVD